MQPRRTPFGVTLDRLTQEFARAVFEAVRKATLAEILGMPDGEAQPDARPSTTAAPPVASAPKRGSRRTPKRVLTARPQAPEASPPVDEPVMPDGTEIDAQALFASIDAERAPIRDGESARSLPAVLEPALPRPAAPAPPPSEPRATSPVLREGEQALRTGNGHVVLRRRRATESAA